jgi:hypothetical protein
MAFEKKVLELAETFGIENSYFAYGTLFVSPDCATKFAISEFAKAYSEVFFGRAEVTYGKEEIAIDFVLA